jgi:lipopolysaccharide export system permease protein
MTLIRYIARRFLWTTTMVFMIFFGVLLLIDVIDQLRRFSDDGVGLGGALILSALNVPTTLYSILPLIMIIAGITLFLGLARTSELVIVRASGQSGLRFLATPVITALALGVLAVMILNPIVASTTKEYDRILAQLAHGKGNVLSITEDGLWLRQGAGERQTVIRASRSNQDATELFDATFMTFDDDGNPLGRIEADEARLDRGFWRLSGTKSWDLSKANPELEAEVSAGDVIIETDLTRDAIRDGFGTPMEIPLWDLPRYIEGLEKAGFSARLHRVWFQMQLAEPLLLASMVLLAAGFTMRHARFGNTGTMVLLALLGGFAIFFLRNFAQVLGDNGQIPVLMAAWIPPLAATMAATGLLLHLEDG